MVFWGGALGGVTWDWWMVAMSVFEIWEIKVIVCIASMIKQW